MGSDIIPCTVHETWDITITGFIWFHQGHHRQEGDIEKHGYDEEEEDFTFRLFPLFAFNHVYHPFKMEYSLNGGENNPLGKRE
jgi:hypothetical protein